MDPDFKWVIVEVDGKVAAVSPDFTLLSDIAARIARLPAGAVNEVRCRKASMQEVAELSKSLKWEDLAPFGSRFQKHVWHVLFTLTHPNDTYVSDLRPASDDADEIVPADWKAVPASSADTREGSGNPYSHLLSYTDFARLCGNEPGTRAVAHAVALNPVAVIIPCHLIVPKETIDRINRIEKAVAPTLFGSYILATASLDFGAYRYGPDLKKSLIIGSF